MDPQSSDGTHSEDELTMRITGHFEPRTETYDIETEEEFHKYLLHKRIRSFPWTGHQDSLRLYCLSLIMLKEHCQWYQKPTTVLGRYNSLLVAHDEVLRQLLKARDESVCGGNGKICCEMHRDFGYLLYGPMDRE
jgi:hypothetical protein